MANHAEKQYIELLFKAHHENIIKESEDILEDTKPLRELL